MSREPVQREDGALAVLLANYVEMARNCLEHYAQAERFGVWPTEPDTSFAEMCIPIRAALKAHSVFSEDVYRSFGSKQLHLGPNSQAGNILRYAVQVGPDAAIEWLHRVYSTHICDIRFVGEIYGVQVAEQLNLCNGVSLVPLADLPQSRVAAMVQAQFHISFGRLPTAPTGTSVGAVTNVWKVKERDASPDVKASVISCEHGEEALIEAARALTLIDLAAPVIGVTWSEFATEDLARAEWGLVWRGPFYEGLRTVGFPVTLDSTIIGITEKYLILNGEIRKKCAVALDRLGLARRRTTPGNKAIEAAIGLEALLSNDNAMEITYKLSLRAALFLETTFEKRIELREAVKSLYALRSKQVHGSKIKSNTDEHALVAEKGVNICARVVTRIVENGHLPNMDKLELESSAMVSANLCT